MNSAEILFTVTMLIIPGMIVDYIIRLTSSRENTTPARIWYWCAYSLIPWNLANLSILTPCGKIFVSIIFALILGIVLACLKQYNVVGKFLNFFTLTTRTSLKTSWEYALINRCNCFVVVHLTDGKVFRGFYGVSSHASDYYEQLDLFLERVYTLDEESRWIHNSEINGLYIPFKDIQAIEFMSNEQDNQ